MVSRASVSARASHSSSAPWKGCPGSLPGVAARLPPGQSILARLPFCELAELTASVPRSTHRAGGLTGRHAESGGELASPACVCHALPSQSRSRCGHVLCAPLKAALFCIFVLILGGCFRCFKLPLECGAEVSSGVGDAPSGDTSGLHSPPPGGTQPVLTRSCS